MERSLNSVVEIVVALSPNLEFLALEFGKEAKDFHYDPSLASPLLKALISCPALEIFQVSEGVVIPARALKQGTLDLLQIEPVANIDLWFALELGNAVPEEKSLLHTLSRLG